MIGQLLGTSQYVMGSLASDIGFQLFAGLMLALFTFGLLRLKFSWGQIISGGAAVGMVVILLLVVGGTFAWVIQVMDSFSRGPK